MFDRIKKSILRDMGYVSESKYGDTPRDGLVHNYLLVEVCERLDKLATYFEHTMVSQMIEISKMHRSVTYYHQESQHTGIMIAFYLDQETAEQLAIPGGEGSSEMHVTLCYLGDMTDFTGDLEQLKATVAQFAASHDGISGYVGGIGRFTPSDSSDNLSPVIALANIPGLQEWRRRLMSSIVSTIGASTLANIIATNVFDFLPHITLAYISPDSPIPVQNVPPIKLSFDTLWLCIGDQEYQYKLGASHEQTNTQSIEGFTDGTTTTYKEASTGEAGTLSESDRISSSGNSSGEDANSGNSVTNANAAGTGDGHSADETPNHFKNALADIIAKEIILYKAGQDFSGHAENGIAQCYLDAQRHAYNKAMQAVDIKTAQEGIIASGIKMAKDAAIAWAVAQIASIVSTLQDSLSNFLADLSSADIATQTEQFLTDYAEWKAPQVANYTWGSGMDIGTGQAISDILGADDLPGIELINMRARVLPEESSSDACKEYAGHDWTLEEYQALGVSWPAHPGCPHYVEIYLDIGDEML